MRRYSHKDLKSSELPEMRRTSSIRMHDLRSCALDVLSADQLMHSWTCSVDGVEYHKVAAAVAAALETNDSNGVTGSLEIDRW